MAERRDKMDHKKIATFFLCILLLSFIPIIEIHAEAKIGYITKRDIPFTKNPNIESPQKSDFVAPNVLHYLDMGDEIISTGVKEKSTVSTCQTDFYQVTHYFNANGKAYTGYICGDYIRFEIDVTPYVEEFTEQGFPKHYWKYLALLKEEHSNWTFKGYQTGIKWSDALDNEAILGKSLLHKNYTGDGGYLDTSSGAYSYLTDTWNGMDGPNWYAANRETVAYYMDPRNFLTEMSIFMFEDLSYQEETHTKEAVLKVLGSEFLGQYIDAFMQAAATYNISPIHLASRVRQEVGTTESVVTSGAEFTLDGKTYSGLYNFYNIGATSGADNWKKGLVWANGVAGQENSYGRPWTTPEKSIIGGAELLKNAYLARGQNTMYFQKWNVVTESPFTNQYMTNIMAPVSEASTVFRSYDSLGFIQKGEEGVSFTFTIPVYTDMPNEKTSLPATGNPNNYLKTLTVNGKSVDHFSSDTLAYTVYVSGASAEINATTINGNAKVSGVGKITLKDKETKQKIVVTAQNGSQKEYTVTLIRTDDAQVSIPDIVSEAGFRIEGDYLSKFSFNQTVSNVKSKLTSVYGLLTITVMDSNGNVKTDDKVIGTGDQIKIEVNGQYKIYQAIVYGDANGDGKLDLTDILYLQRHYLKVEGGQLVGIYYKATDVDRNGNIDLTDLLQFQRQYLKIASIAQ